MSTEMWIACSVAFSILLAGIGWVVQFRLLRDHQRHEAQRRSLEESLLSEANELKELRDALRAGELTAMFLALAWPGDRTAAEIDALAENAKSRLGSIPRRDELYERIENIERSLATIAAGIDQLTRVQLVPAPFSDCDS